MYNYIFINDMKNKNDITGDLIKSKTHNHEAYAKGWDKIFNRKEEFIEKKVKARKAQPKHSITQIHKDKTKSHPRMYKYKGIQEDEV